MNLPQPLRWSPIRRRPPVLIVFVLLTITLLVLAMTAFASQPGITVLGGSIGLLTAIATWGRFG
jgi:succinate-acetate transporter protein